MDFDRLSKALGLLGIVALVAGIVLWQKENRGAPGYVHCLYSHSYKWSGYVSPYSNPRWDPENTACSTSASLITPPLLNGIGVGLILLALVIGYASAKPSNPFGSVSPQHPDIGVQSISVAPQSDKFEGQSNDELLGTLGAWGYKLERNAGVILAGNGGGTHHLYSRADIVRLLEAEIAKRAARA